MCILFIRVSVKIFSVIAIRGQKKCEWEKIYENVVLSLWPHEFLFIISLLNQVNFVYVHFFHRFLSFGVYVQ